MKIQPIDYNTQNWEVFCFDDEMSKERRDCIREYIETKYRDEQIRNSGRLAEDNSP